MQAASSLAGWLEKYCPGQASSLMLLQGYAVSASMPGPPGWRGEGAVHPGRAGRLESRGLKTKNPPFSDGDKKRIARYAGWVKSCAPTDNLSSWTFCYQERLPGLCRRVRLNGAALLAAAAARRTGSVRLPDRQGRGAPSGGSHRVAQTKTKNPSFADGDKNRIPRYAGRVKARAAARKKSCQTDDLWRRWRRYAVKRAGGRGPGPSLPVAECQRATSTARLSRTTVTCT